MSDFPVTISFDTFAGFSLAEILSSAVDLENSCCPRCLHGAETGMANKTTLFVHMGLSAKQTRKKPCETVEEGSKLPWEVLQALTCYIVPLDNVNVLEDFREHKHVGFAEFMCRLLRFRDLLPAASSEEKLAQAAKEHLRTCAPPCELYDDSDLDDFVDSAQDPSDPAVFVYLNMQRLTACAGNKAAARFGSVPDTRPAYARWLPTCDEDLTALLAYGLYKEAPSSLEDEDEDLDLLPDGPLVKGPSFTAEEAARDQEQGVQEIRQAIELVFPGSSSLVMPYRSYNKSKATEQ